MRMIDADHLLEQLLALIEDMRFNVSLTVGMGLPGLAENFGRSLVLLMTVHGMVEAMAKEPEPNA